MSRAEYAQISLNTAAAAALKELKEDLARAGTASLPEALGKFGGAVTLSDVVMMGVRSVRQSMKGGRR